MDTENYVVIFSFFAFLAFLGFLAFKSQSPTLSYAVTPNYVQTPESLRRG